MITVTCPLFTHQRATRYLAKGHQQTLREVRWQRISPSDHVISRNDGLSFELSDIGESSV